MDTNIVHAFSSESYFAELENFFSNFSFLILFLGMLIYWIQASNYQTKNELIFNIKNEEILSVTPSLYLPPKGGKSNNQRLLLNGVLQGTGVKNVVTDNKIFNGVPYGHNLNLFDYFNNFFQYLSNERNIGIILTAIANISLFLLLVLRWFESGHFPLSNLYESLMFLSWSLTMIHLLIEFVFSSKSDRELGKNKEMATTLRSLARDLQSRKSSFGNSVILDSVFNKKMMTESSIKLIGSIISPCALFTNAFATFSLPKEMQEASPLVPALQSNWLMMHVTVMILSYAALIFGSLLSIGFLVITEFPFSSTNKYKYNLARILDNLSYRVLGFGFPLLTIGILSGAVWANEAWGSYWSWDPKETWALLTWLVFAIYLHTRLTKGWEGKKPALIASLGFITVWICFLGVNLIGEGLHSYGWINL